MPHCTTAKTEWCMCETMHTSAPHCYSSGRIFELCTLFLESIIVTLVKLEFVGIGQIVFMGCFLVI